MKVSRSAGSRHVTRERAQNTHPVLSWKRCSAALIRADMKQSQSPHTYASGFALELLINRRKAL